MGMEYLLNSCVTLEASHPLCALAKHDSSSTHSFRSPKPLAALILDDAVIPSPLLSETADSAQKRWSMKILVPPVWSHKEFPIKSDSSVLIAASFAAAGLATIQATL